MRTHRRWLSLLLMVWCGWLALDALPAFAQSETGQSADWTAVFFDDPELSDTPAVVQLVPAINFDWGAGAPAAELNPDNFSIRFERTIELAPGFYHLLVKADDGVRVYVDNQLVIDEWHFYAAGHSNGFSTIQQLAGTHQLRIEYQEQGGEARIQFNMSPVSMSYTFLPVVSHQSP